MIKNISNASIFQTFAKPVEEPTIKHFKILMPGEWVEAFGITVINTSDIPIRDLHICPVYPAHNLDSFHPEIVYTTDEGGNSHYLYSGGFFKFVRVDNKIVFVRIDREEFAQLQNKNKPKPSNRLKELTSRV